MPILEITIVLKRGEVLPVNTAAAVADAASKVFKTAPGHTWVRLTRLSPEDYAEDGGSQNSAAPVFVTVLKGQLGDTESLQREAARLASTVGRTLNRPAEHVHIIYEPEGLGRIAFGGELLLE